MSVYYQKIRRPLVVAALWRAARPLSSVQTIINIAGHTSMLAKASHSKSQFALLQ